MPGISEAENGTMKYKVVFTEADLAGDWHEERELLAKVDAELVYLGTTDPETVKAAVADADAVIVSYAQIDADIIAAMRHCRSISKLGIGVNNIDVPAATAKGIRVMNAPNYCIEEVSDMIVGLTLTLSRGIAFSWQNIQSGKWEHSTSPTIMRLAGKTFGFLGYGKIARCTAKKIAAHGMKILAYDPYISAESAAEAGAELVSMDELVRRSDVISLNLPLTEETTGIVNRDFFRNMKKSAIFINTARGPMVDEAALCEALLNGEIAGAGLDVLCTERCDPENPVFNLPNVVITPHASFYSPESVRDLKDEVFQDVVAVLSDREPAFQLNRKR